MPLTRRQLVLIVFGWAVFAWLNGTLLYFGILAEGVTPQWTYLQFVMRQAGRWVVWPFLIPAIVLLLHRVPVALRARPLSIHIAASVVAAAMHATNAVVSDLVIAPRPGSGFAEVWLGMLTFYAPIDLVLYWATVGVVLAVESRRRLRERELLLAQAQLANLRLQIQPHFLFNTLHTIASLVRQGSSEGAVTMIAGLSDLLRYSLDNAGRDVVPLSEELEVVRRYLEIQQTRFSDRLRVTVDAAADTYDAAVPTLLLQPLVENAIRHGDPTIIDVRSRRDGEELVIEIANDDSALRPDWCQHEGVGLSSTRRRLEQLHASLELEPRQPSGAVARVRIPYARELG